MLGTLNTVFLILTNLDDRSAINMTNKKGKTPLFYARQEILKIISRLT